MSNLRNSPCSCGSGKKYKHCCGKVGINNSDLDPKQPKGYYKFNINGEEQIILDFPNIVNVMTPYRDSIQEAEIIKFGDIHNYLKKNCQFVRDLQNDVNKLTFLFCDLSVFLGFQLYESNYYSEDTLIEIKNNIDNKNVIMANDENTEEFNLLIGQYFQKRGMPEVTISLYHIAEKINPKFWPTLFYIATTYSLWAIKLIFEENEKLSWENKILRKSYKNPRISEYFNNADSYFVKCIQYGGENMEILNNWASSLSEAGRYNEAISKYERVLEISSINEVNSFGLAVCYMRLENFEKACHYFEEHQKVYKISENPLTNKITYVLMGYCYYKLNLYDDSIKWYNEAIYIDNSDEFLQKMIEIIYLKKNQTSFIPAIEFDDILKLYSEENVNLKEQNTKLLELNKKLSYELDLLKNQLLSIQTKIPEISKIKVPFNFCVMGDIVDKQILYSELNQYFLKYGIAPDQWNLDIFSNEKIKNQDLFARLKRGSSKYQLAITGNIYKHSTRQNSESNLFTELKKEKYIPFIIGCEPQSLLTNRRVIAILEEFINKTEFIN